MRCLDNYSANLPEHIPATMAISFGFTAIGHLMFRASTFSGALGYGAVGAVITLVEGLVRPIFVSLANTPGQVSVLRFLSRVSVIAAALALSPLISSIFHITLMASLANLFFLNCLCCNNDEQNQARSVCVF